MFNWILRILTVALAFWLSHAYVVTMSGGSLSPVSFETLKHSVLTIWIEVQRGLERFDWVILSPLAIGLVLVVVLACGLLRPAGR